MPLVQAITGSDLSLAQSLIEKEQKILLKTMYPNGQHFTLLPIWDMLILFVFYQKEANVNVKDKYQETHLHIAVTNGHLEVVKLCWKMVPTLLRKICLVTQRCAQ